jgi:hypothetical protein
MANKQFISAMTMECCIQQLQLVRNKIKMLQDYQCLTYVWEPEKMFSENGEVIGVDF